MLSLFVETIHELSKLSMTKVSLNDPLRLAVPKIMSEVKMSSRHYLRSKHMTRKHHGYITLAFIFLWIGVLGVGCGKIYSIQNASKLLLGSHNQQAEETIHELSLPTPTASPTPYPLPTGTPLLKNTVSFTSQNNHIYVRYKGSFYDGDDETNNPVKVAISDVESYPWVGLTDGPKQSDPIAFDEIFSFRQSSRDFLFILRFDSWLDSGKRGDQTFKVFHYDFGAAPHLTQIQTFTAEFGKTGYVFPKIDAFSPDHAYASIKLFSCWNCSISSHQLLLIQLKTHQTKLIGPVGSFVWNTNGQYAYQDEPSRPCDQNIKDGCPQLKQLPVRYDHF